MSKYLQLLIPPVNSCLTRSQAEVNTARSGPQSLGSRSLRVPTTTWQLPVPNPGGFKLNGSTFSTRLRYIADLF